MTRPLRFIPLVCVLAACSTTVDGSGWRLDGGRDVPPGLNPDGDDPFRPTDAGVIRVDGSVDRPAFDPPDAAVVDQRSASIVVGNYATGSITQADFRLFPRPEETRCTYVSASSWDIVTCRDGESPRDPHPLPFPNAGTITVGGGLQRVSIFPTTRGQYGTNFDGQVNFPGPRTITVSAPGSRTVPAFALTAEVPAALTLLAPAQAGGRMVVARDAELAVAWQPTAARSVSVSLSAQGTLEGERVALRIFAEFNGATGRGVIPRRVIGELSRLTAVTELTLSAAAQNVVTRRVGSWPVQIVTQGQGVNASVTLQ